MADSDTHKRVCLEDQHTLLDYCSKKIAKCRTFVLHVEYCIVQSILTKRTHLELHHSVASNEVALCKPYSLGRIIATFLCMMMLMYSIKLLHQPRGRLLYTFIIAAGSVQLDFSRGFFPCRCH